MADQITVGKPGTRVRQIQVDQQPFVRRVVIRPSDAGALGRAPWSVGSRVALEHQFGVEMELPEAQRGLEIRNDLSANTQLRAFRTHQRSDRINRVSGARIDVRGRAAAVVAVEAFAEVHEILGLLPWTENDRELRRADACTSAPRVLPDIAIDLEVVAVGANPGDGAQPVGPLRLVLGVKSVAGFADSVLPLGRYALPLHGVGDRDRVEAVLPNVPTQRVGRVQAEELVGSGPTPIAAQDLAVVVLVELVTVDRIVQIVGEIGIELEVVANGVCGALQLAASEL